MKKIFMLFAALMLTITASAQFEAGKAYVSGSLTGLDLNYNSNTGLRLGVDAKAGYFMLDDWMLVGGAGFEHDGKHGSNNVYAELGGRYYIEQNGLYLGAGAKFLHKDHNYNDVMPSVEVGYAYFISRTVTVEPSIYYNQSFKNHSRYSTFGFKIGFGIYL